MTIIAAAAICVVLLIISFVAPTMSQHPERGVVAALGYPLAHAVVLRLRLVRLARLRDAG